MNGLNPYTLAALVILAVGATAQYYLGTKKNRWIASTITRGAEEALRPRTVNYVNIGGAIGHNFTYALAGEWTSAKGTLTLSPRHSLLYRPISLLIGVRDRFYVNLFTKRKLRGEGHIVEAAHLRRARIDGLASMERREVSAGERRFVLLWKGADLSADLERLLAGMPDPSRLVHFCAFADNKTFFLHTNPKEGEVRADLEYLLPRLGAFMAGGKEE